MLLVRLNPELEIIYLESYAKLQNFRNCTRSADCVVHVLHEPSLLKCFKTKLVRSESNVLPNRLYIYQTSMPPVVSKLVRERSRILTVCNHACCRCKKRNIQPLETCALKALQMTKARGEKTDAHATLMFVRKSP